MSILITNKSGSGNAAAATNNYSNSLINGNFDFFQRNLGSPTVNVTAGSQVYVADRWYLTNTAGSGGVVLSGQTLATNVGSDNGLASSISTAPSSGTTTSFDITQTLCNADSLIYYNGVASFSCLIRALGNITQVGIQFLYATTEVKATTGIGTQTLVSVTNSGFTLCSIINQAIGTAMTHSGVIGIRIRPTAVSSGNVSDLNNGIIIEQAIITPTATLLPFRRAGNTIDQELLSCQKYCYITSSALNANARFGIGVVVSIGTVRSQYNLPVTMRAEPTLSFSAASTFMLEAGNITATCASIADNTTTSQNVLSISSTVATTFTVGFAAELTANSTTSAYILADADI